jgi:CheY-like chemotaxis protein
MPLPILVVEDNNINREVAVLQLRALGYEAIIADDGFAALELVKKQQFAMILMDVMMPSMDGWEAARKIRQMETGTSRHTPIVGFSAWSASDNRTRCLASGMDDYLSKPYERVELKRVIERWVKTEAGN